jgi:hypothetical protein
MNSSIEINFQPGGRLALVTDGRVEGFKAVVQNALVNMLTENGTDMLFPTRGTNLFKKALAGGIFNYRSASHACNFAAVDTLFFSREFETADTADKLNRVDLEPSAFSLGSLDARAGFTSIDGRTMSFAVPT